MDEQTKQSFTPDLEQFNEKNQFKSVVKSLIISNRWNLSQFSLDNISEYEQWKVSPSKSNTFRMVITDFMCEFYWCQKREFSFKKEVMEKYWVPENVYQFVSMYWDIWTHTMNHTKQYVWDWAWMENKPNMTPVSEMQNISKVDDDLFVPNYVNDIKKQIWDLTVEQLWTTDEKEIKKIQKSIDKLKKLLDKQQK